MTAYAQDKWMAAMERDGRQYVSAQALINEVGIAVKPLPTQKEFVVCVGDRCAIVKDVFEDRGETYVAVRALTQALGVRAKYKAKEGQVALDFSSRAAEASLDTPLNVGALAPNFRLPKLDGGSVALSDFRGKRVLINSWASW